MTEFLNALNWFALGLVIGYFWTPLFRALATIWTELKIAQKEWRHHD
jgi:hypothetical protein